MSSLFTINFESDQSGVTAKMEGNADLDVITGETSVKMAADHLYGPFSKYYSTKYPDDPSTYPGGQVSIMLNNQQCGPATNQYQTVLFLSFDNNNNLSEAWAFNISMTPASGGSLGQFANFNAAYGSATTSPNAFEIAKIAVNKGASIKYAKAGNSNTWKFDNGRCFTINFQANPA